MNNHKQSVIMNAFLCFAEKILSGKEGAFFILDRDEINTNPDWVFGYGNKEFVDFDTPVFPKFCTTNFLGDANRFYVFEHTVMSDDFSGSEVDLSKVEEILNGAEKFLLEKDLPAYASETEDSFVQKVKNIQEFEREGNAWVVNMTQNIVGDLPTEMNRTLLALSAFYEFLKSDSSVCGGVLITNEQLFCSFSPEVFLKQEQGQISTFPIKGTGTKLELEDSEKEIAELHMITDLLRNDFGQVCDAVEVKRERYLTKEKDFYHAQSEIIGMLGGTGSLSWKDFQSLLPAGSISGAPKKKVVEKILSLENFDRHFYTGTFGIQFSPEKSIYNVLIRTLFLGAQHWYFPVGSGITVESDPQSEYRETFDKAKVFVRFCTQ